MFPTALTADETAIVGSGSGALTNVGLAAVGVSVAGLAYLGLRAVYSTIVTAIRSRGSRI